MLALITGASSGIGLEYAKELARQGFDLMIISNQENDIFATAEQLSKQYDVSVRPYFMDLAVENAAELLFHYCQEVNITVDVLINNAGVFFFNDLIETSGNRASLMINLHVHTVTQMCRLFGADMAKRGGGYILNMSSMSAWMAMPGINVYNATKAYILNFSRSLWYELKPHGVYITAVCPGAIDTGLYGLSPKWRKIAVALGISMRPEKLVRKALRALFSGKKYVVPGCLNKPFLFIIKHLPDWLIFKVANKLKQFQK